jgi:RNA polymerase sigma factor (sigma-70 family)
MSEKSLQQYISEIANSILPAEEERRLILIYLNQESGWQEAQNLVIKSNMMFVVKTAYEFSNDSQRILELVSEGNLSLLESLNKFDPSKGFKFLTYASFNIRGRMLKYMLRSCNFSALKLSLRNIELAKKAKDFVDTYNLENNQNPSVEEIAKHCDIENNRALLIAEIAGSHIFSIQSVVEKDHEERALQVADESMRTPDKQINEKEMSSVIEKIISNLSMRQQVIIKRRFGLDGEGGKDLATIGLELDLTKERIRQIEQSTLKQIRRELEKVKVESFN